MTKEMTKSDIRRANDYSFGADHSAALAEAVIDFAKTIPQGPTTQFRKRIV
jgi:hypothetical protein